MQQAMQHLRNSPASDNVDVIDLVQAMLRFSPNGRPKAQFVERQCREILDKMSEQNLRGWAKRVIPPLAEQDVEATEDMASWTGSTYPDATGGSISADLATMSGAVKVPPKSTGPPIWATVALTALAGWSLAMFLMAAVWVLMPRIYEADRFVPLAEGIVEKLVADELEADSDPVGSAATEDAAEDPAGQE
jgi:hypothetical protein